MVERFNLSEWALNRREFIYYLIFVFLIAGVIFYPRLGRNEDPNFTVKTMVVQAKWPGASINDTLNQLTERIEKTLQEVPHVDYVQSFTSPGSTTIYVNLLDSTPEKYIGESWYQVRKKIQDIAPTMPQDVLGPYFNDEVGETYGIIYAFESDGFSQRELLDYVENVRTQLLHVPDVSKIKIIGDQAEKIYVEFSVRKLAGMGITPKQLIQILQTQNSIKPAGILETDKERLLLRVSGVFDSETELRNTNIVIDGKLLTLGDIATVTRGYVDPPQFLFRSNGKPAIGIAISMVSGGDILALGRNIHKAMQRIITTLPWGIKCELVADQPTVVKKSIGEFIKSLQEAFVIVLLVSFLSLGLRAGAVVACSIPLVLAIVFIIMDFYQIDLQRISLGALIISLGLLVDDAIITTEMMIMKLEEGWDKVRAATYAYTSTAFPMLTGTIVTVAGFIPIGFSKGSAGEYVFSLFAVIAIALIASWFVAVIFIPLIGVAFLPAKLTYADTQNSRMMRTFRSMLLTAMEHPKKIVCISIALFIISVGCLRYIPQQFFPSSDRPELLVNLQLAQNSSIHATNTEVRKLEELLKNNDDIVSWSSYIGQGAIRFYLPLDSGPSNPAFSQTVVVTKSIEARERVRKYLEKALIETFYALNTRVMPLEVGPPVGWPLQYRVSGKNQEVVRDLSYKVAQLLSMESNVKSVNFDWIEPTRVLRIKVNQDQAKLLGISSEDISFSLNTVVSGINITQVRDHIYLVDVVIRAKSQNDEPPIALLETLQIPTPTGEKIPLTQIASIEYKQEYPLIWHYNRLPTITVQADIVNGVLPATIVKRFESKISELNKTLPHGYSITNGGTTEESIKAQKAVAASVPLMSIIIITILMIQLQSVQKVILVLSVVPLGLIGVVATLLLANKPMGFVAILGIISLTGIIIRNSLIVVGQIDLEISNGLSPWDAVITAVMHRFRPVVLTATATILGMIPIAPTVFWGPMAYAIMGGLVVATILTLLFLPALYCLWFKVRPASVTISS